MKKNKIKSFQEPPSSLHHPSVILTEQQKWSFQNVIWSTLLLRWKSFSFFYFLRLTACMTWLVWFPLVSNTISRTLSSAHRGPATLFSLFLDMPHSFPQQGLCPGCFLCLERSSPTLHMVSSSSPSGYQLECPLLWETIPHHCTKRRSLPYYSLPAACPFPL